MNLWIVGKTIEGSSTLTWEFQGVFSSQELAEAACRDGYYFVGPALLDEVLDDKTEEWPGCYRPIALL